MIPLFVDKTIANIENHNVYFKLKKPKKNKFIKMLINTMYSRLRKMNYLIVSFKEIEHLKF